MKRTLTLVFATLLLVSCVDTTGISPESSRPPAGNPGAAVTVLEFSDLQCPACRAAYPTVVKPLIEKYKKEVRFEYVHFPLLSLHRYAMDLAEAAECSADQKKFWEFVDMAFTKQDEIAKAGDELAKSNITEWAQALGIDMDLFSRCTRSHIKKAEIMNNYDEGTKMGVQGTPTFFVNGQATPATVADLSAAIETALKGTMKKL